MLIEPRRLLSSALAIMLGVAFVAASLLLGDALNASMRSAAAGTLGDATAVVVAQERNIRPETVAGIQQLPSVTSVRAVGVTAFPVSTDGVQTFYTAQNLPPLSATTRLVSGRLPSAMGEVAPTAVTARGADLALGSPLQSGEHGQLTVVGIIDAGTDALSAPGMPTLFVTDAQLLKWVDGYGTLYVRSTASTEELAKQILALPGVKSDSLAVDSAAVVAQQQVNDLAGGTTTLVTLLLTFAAVALFTAALVIANTFSILVAQRARQMALLRCVGATKGQVFRTVLAEAAVVAGVASTLGVLLGLGLSLLVMKLSESTPMALTSLQPSVASFVLPVGVGIVVTLLAALVPARRATQIAPLAALRTTAVANAEGPSRTQVVLGAALVTVGLAALIASAVAPTLRPTSNQTLPTGLIVGMSGGLVSFIGILLLAGLIVPAAARLMAPALRPWGIAGELATENAVRNPRRAAATASALLIGVTLITMMSVGAASAEASTMARLNGRYPVDAIVEGNLGNGAAAAQAARSASSVAQMAVVGHDSVTITSAEGSPMLDIYGLNPGDAGVARNASFATGLSDDTVVLPRSTEIATGTTVTLTGSGGAVTLRAVMADRSGTPALVTPATLNRLAPKHATVLWARFTDGSDSVAATTALGKAVATAAPGASVSGAASARAEFKKILDTVLGVVVGLLGVAVLIALVGIGNTLSLSVLERTHESGLLRALGLSKRQLRRSVGLEAVLLAGVAAVLGLALGIGYGIVGTYSLVPPGTVVILDVPWLRLAAVVLVALAAGWVASVLPSIRAARVSPAMALAEE